MKNFKLTKKKKLNRNVCKLCMKGESRFDVALVNPQFKTITVFSHEKITSEQSTNLQKVE
jgi:hypothetical protein